MTSSIRKLLMAFAQIEPQSRYDLFDVSTTAKRSGSDWVLDGKKVVLSIPPGTAAGTERATPMNVTTRASEIASATSFALMPASDRAMTMKLAIIPFRVPSKPIIGPKDPRTANMLIFFSISTT